MISTLPAASSLANLFTIPATTAASALGISPNLITPAMEEELRKQIMSDIKRTGTYSGGISYEDLGFDTIWNKSGEHIDISKNPFFRNPTHGIFSPQQAIGLTGGKMDWSADPITGKITWDGGKYDFGTKGSGWVDNKNVGWNPDLTIDPALMKKEIDAFSPHERWRQGQIQMADPVKVYENSPDHYKMKFQENKVPFEAIPDPWKPATGPNIFNQGQMEVDDKVPYLTRREILAKKKAEQLRLAKVAEQQRLDKIAEQQRLAKVAEQQRLDKITATEQARPTNNWINGVQTQASIDRGNRAVAAAGGSMDDFSGIPVPTPSPAYIPPVTSVSPSTPYSPPPRVHNPVVRGNPAPRGTGFEYKGGRPTGPMGYGL